MQSLFFGGKWFVVRYLYDTNRFFFSECMIPQPTGWVLVTVNIHKRDVIFKDVTVIKKCHSYLAVAGETPSPPNGDEAKAM